MSTQSEPFAASNWSQDFQRLASIVNSSDDAILSRDLKGIITSWNRAAERLFGYSEDEAIGNSMTVLIAPGGNDEEDTILQQLRGGGHVDRYETAYRRKDGSLVEISVTASPVSNAEGHIIGVSKIARDITDRKRAQAQQTLLLSEMHHRVRNLFALASSVVMLSSRSAATPQKIAQNVGERLRALTRAHELTLPTCTSDRRPGHARVTLQSLLQTILSPYVSPDQTFDERLLVCGPEVMIGEKAVTSLALLLHELATNAVKYGALSSPNGRVIVEYSLERGHLLLTWNEQGGPLLDTSSVSEGFGSFLARTTVTNHFGGEFSRNWKREGVIVRLSARIERLAI